MTPLYQRLLTAPTAAALAQLHADQNSTGTAPDDDLDVLAGLVVASKARRILQFGTFLGGSALVLADLARDNGDGALVVTVDPNPAMNESCRKYAALAGLGDIIQTRDGFSTDPALLLGLRNFQSVRAWDMIFLDTTHQYGQTVAEIKAIAPLCGPHTLFAFHDASLHAAEALDVGHQGGVRRAMREYCLTHPAWQMYVYEQPAFGQFGIGVMSKRSAP
jgi:predicted O-methyltransferase YrrM